MNFINSITLLSNCYRNHGYAVFRAACAVTDPMWTRGSNDPATWHAPPDAAGGLCLWADDGYLIRVEPPCESREDEERAAGYALDGLRNSGCLIGKVAACYASSGGRMVALCWSQGQWIITVGRTTSGPPLVCQGTTERAIMAADPAAQQMLCGLTAEASDPAPEGSGAGARTNAKS